MKIFRYLGWNLLKKVSVPLLLVFCTWNWSCCLKPDTQRINVPWPLALRGQALSIWHRTTSPVYVVCLALQWPHLLLSRLFFLGFELVSLLSGGSKNRMSALIGCIFAFSCQPYPFYSLCAVVNSHICFRISPAIIWQHYFVLLEAQMMQAA